MAPTSSWSASRTIRAPPIPYSSREVLDTGVSQGSIITNFLNPKTVGLTALYNQIVFLVLVTLILAIAVWRSRVLVRGR